jgi:hypothetical protein
MGGNSQPVTLYMCNSGTPCPSGGENYAQRLANELGVPVRAPNGILTLHQRKGVIRVLTRPTQDSEYDKAAKIDWFEPKKCDKN